MWFVLKLSHGITDVAFLTVTEVSSPPGGVLGSEDCLCSAPVSVAVSYVVALTSPTPAS
jgi:hypothetical protein